MDGNIVMACILTSGLVAIVTYLTYQEWLDSRSFGVPKYKNPPPPPPRRTTWGNCTRCGGVTKNDKCSYCGIPDPQFEIKK